MIIWLLLLPLYIGAAECNGPFGWWMRPTLWFSDAHINISFQYLLLVSFRQNMWSDQRCCAGCPPEARSRCQGCVWWEIPAFRLLTGHLTWIKEIRIQCLLGREALLLDPVATSWKRQRSGDNPDIVLWKGGRNSCSSNFWQLFEMFRGCKNASGLRFKLGPILRWSFGVSLKPLGLLVRMKGQSKGTTKVWQCKGDAGVVSSLHSCLSTAISGLPPSCHLTLLSSYFYSTSVDCCGW